MSSCICAPGIEADIADAKAMGVGILGCCGDSKHTYGFHREAAALSTSDYSIRRSTGIKNKNWGCAGDFATVLPWSRDWLQWTVGEAQAGRLGPIVEIIGSLDGKTASYWAKWNGWKRQRYTGSGHVDWAHFSWDRALADQKAGLFAKYSKGTAGGNRPGFSIALKLTSPFLVSPQVALWQQAMKNKGHTISVDGVFGPQSDKVARAFQRARGLTVDGIVGPQTWAASFS